MARLDRKEERADAGTEIDDDLTIRAIAELERLFIESSRAHFQFERLRDAMASDDRELVAVILSQLKENQS